MYRLFRSLTFRQLILEQAPALGGSLLIAELFYKFHSFLLETAAFLGTWFVVDLMLRATRNLAIKLFDQGFRSSPTHQRQ